MTSNDKRLQYQIGGALLGLALGVAIVLWREHSVPSPEYLRVAEQEHLIAMRNAEEAQDRADMQGACTNETIKALRSGLIAACKNGQWSRSGIDNSNQAAYR